MGSCARVKINILADSIIIRIISVMKYFQQLLN